MSPPQTPGRGRSRSPGRRPRRHHHDSAQLDRLRSAPPSSRRVDDGSALAAAEAAAAATLAAEEHARAAAAAATAAAAALGVAPAAVAAAEDGRKADARRVELAKAAKVATPRRAPAETADQAERERVANYLVMCATKAAGEGAQVLDATVAELGNVQLDRALRAFMGADVEKSGDIDVWAARALASLAAEIPTAAPSRRGGARDALFAQVDLDSSGSVNWGEFPMAWPTILQTATHTMGGGGSAAAEGAPSGARGGGGGGGGGGTPRRTSVGAAVGATVDAPLDVASRVQLQRTVRALEEVLPKATSLRELGNARPLLALVHSMGEEGLVKTAELFKEFARGDRDDGLLDADEVKELAAALADEEGVTFQEMLRGLTTSPRVVAAREATLGNRRRGSKRVEVEARGGRLDFVRFARRLEEVCRRHQPGQTVDFEGYEQVAIRVALDEGHTAIAEDESGEAAAARRRALALMRTYDPQLHGFLGAAPNGGRPPPSSARRRAGSTRPCSSTARFGRRRRARSAWTSPPSSARSPTSRSTRAASTTTS